MTAGLRFLGAAGTVTGAKFLVEAAGARVLLECGMFQGPRELRERNWQAPPVEPATLDAVVLSHAHIDHSGYLPRLAREGFAGPVFCSSGTADLLTIMLPDAARLQEEEAEYRNRKRRTRFSPAQPLFGSEDAERALRLLRPVAFGEAFAPGEGIEAALRASGHILGASIVEVAVDGRRLVYSGDLGRYGVPIMRDPESVAEADTLLVESTYGNRLHPADDGTPVLVEAVQGVVERGGWLVVPAFAVGRTQDVLFLLRRLERAGRVPAIPVYLDSPMAIEATRLYARHREEHDPGTPVPFVPARFQVCRTAEESKQLNEIPGPAIVVAGSGMATGGRVLHHLRRRLPEASATVLFVGYQAAGTRGRLLRDGAQSVSILGEEVTVHARILATDALSAHADRRELLRWLAGFRRAPARTWCVHGEPEAAEALRAAIGDELGWACAVARDMERVDV